MSEISGFFIDWDGNIRNTQSPGKGYRCEVDTVARYVAIYGKYGVMAHEATFYPTLEALAAAGITSKLVDENGNPV